MNREMIISVDIGYADVFIEFADKHPEVVMPVRHKASIGGVEIVDFIIQISPELLAALSAYLVAKVQLSKHTIKLKKGEVEIELTNTELTPDEALELLKKLEK